MGRPRKPTNLKVVQGTTRPDRLTKNEPIVPLSIPKCPSFLNAEGKRYWKKTAEQLDEAGLIGSTDGAMFALHCDSFGRYEQISRGLQTLEDLVIETPNGAQQQAALWQIRNKLWEQVQKSATEFGLSPASRCKISLPEKPKQEENKFATI